MGFINTVSNGYNDDDDNQSMSETYDDESQAYPLDLSIHNRYFENNHSYSLSLPLPQPIAINQPIISDVKMSTNFLCEMPSIVTQPKPEWHYRSIKDLAKNHIPMLSGDGPQRTPIRVQVPENISQTMFLAVAVRTIDHSSHDSKVIVPQKTRVRSDIIFHDNNLQCLDFTECSSKDHFDLNTRNLYLEITHEEHRAQLKEVRVYMFNLYQNQDITKEVIGAKKLDLCQLEFWLCAVSNGVYMRISESSFSSVIQEKKASSRQSAAEQMNNSNRLSSHRMCQDYFNQFKILD